MLQATVLIPAFNEKNRIGTVLQPFLTLPWIQQIIVIDDGSTDNLGKFLVTNFPQIKLISQATNQGKTAAIQAGLNQVTTPWVLLFDADIWQFQTSELTLAWNQLKTHPQFDVLILQAISDPWYQRLGGFDILFSGERLIKTSVLKRFFKSHQPKNYELELVFNHWCFKTGIKLTTWPLAMKNHAKLQKWPRWQALPRSWSVYGQWLTPRGFFELVWQIFTLPKRL